ncbi:hypothetical protein BJ165DRAFT_1532435 [Panaeolus papilionaceus]|nr:hypothetical protein BJ165DRAFT_1532435 [Panaeolus papilionaceus]
MRKLWNSHYLPKIFDRLICVESFGFVIPPIYLVDPTFGWDTLSEEMKLGISNLVSKPSVTTLAVFRCLAALPVTLFATSPSLRHLSVGLIDRVESLVASSHMSLTTNVAPQVHREDGWRIQSLNAERGSQSLLLHSTIEGCLAWCECPPKYLSATPNVL